MQPYMLMRSLCVQGRIFRDATLPGLTATERRAIHTAMVTTLAQLHSIDWKSVGLEGFGGKTETRDYCQRQVGIRRDRQTDRLAHVPTLCSN